NPWVMVPSLPKTMRSLRWYAPEQIQLDTVPLPQVGPGEALVKIGAATTCGTDFKTFRRGHPRLIREIPAPFGHEMAGTVAAVGPGVKGFSPGDRVVVGNSAPCGQCFYCRKKSPALCEDLQFLNGAYSDFILVPARIVEVNLHPIPDSLSFATAALSEPLACVLNAFEKVGPRAGESVLLIGAGPMGVLFAQLAKLYGTSLIALARDPEKLKNLQKHGAREVISLTQDEKPLEQARLLLNEGRGADIVIEAVGLPETWEMAVDLARPGGRVCFYGGCAQGTSVSLDTYRLHYEELNLFGVFHHTPAFFKKAVELLSDEKIKPEGLVVGEIPLEDYGLLFRKGMKSNPLKYAVVP
ncbi:MAG: alcohol dehydrogenase catalytic domain-containing protein, partial [bacterium]|nr:alcohol dehydrogenase catalytic domain-containing protein [bacterium]